MLEISHFDAPIVAVKTIESNQPIPQSLVVNCSVPIGQKHHLKTLERLSRNISAASRTRQMQCFGDRWSTGDQIGSESPQARSKLKIRTKKVNKKRRVFDRLEEGNPLSHRK